MNDLRLRRSSIRARWEDLLRVERATSPLANPDALVHLIDWTLDEIFRTLESLPSRRRPLRSSARPEIDCPCGMNPLLTYFAAAEQALQESLVLAEAAHLPLDPAVRDTALAELNHALRHIAHREIQAFCALCQLRHRAPCTPTTEPAHAVLKVG